MVFQTDVNVSALQQQSKVWDNQSTIMGQIVSQIKDTQQSEPTASTIMDSIVFSSALTAYKAVAQYYLSLSEQGESEMASVGTALNDAAKNYNDSEQANVQSVNNVG
jgi:hypothetical protein